MVHTRRLAWRSLSEADAALLDFLRNRGKASELSPEQTVQKLLESFAEFAHFARIGQAAPSEPPRVRAMLGATTQTASREYPVAALEP